MTERAFHHGNLRAELLDRAEQVLRDRGTDALSLRELARDAGVSHGAPRSHFIDRNALLDALAARGYARLTDEVRAAAARHPSDDRAALRAAGAAYVDFAVRESALLDLMFAVKVEGPSPSVVEAAEGLFVTMSGLVSAGSGVTDAAALGRLTLLLSATVQGIASFVASGRIAPGQTESVLDDAMAMLPAPA